MAPHPPHHAPATTAPTAPIGRDAGGVPLVDLLRSGLIRLNAPAPDPHPSARAV